MFYSHTDRCARIPPFSFYADIGHGTLHTLPKKIGTLPKKGRNRMKFDPSGYSDRSHGLAK